MEDKIKKLQQDIADAEEALKDPQINSDPEFVEVLNADIAKYKAEIESLTKQAETAVEKAESKVETAETKEEKAEAKEELSEAKKNEKQVEKVADKIEKVEQKAEQKTEEIVREGKRRVGRPRIERMPVMKGKHGGKRVGAGRKAKASSEKRIVKPKKYKPKGKKPVFIRKKVKPTPSKAVVKAKVKTVRAFGQTVEYKNDSEFCSKLIKAFKKRRAVYKKSKKKTRPVFGVITSKIKDAVTKAIDNTPKKQIESNPKAFLAKAQRLEKSAIRFLEDFKAILGSDFKKSEISAEFGDLEKSIKKLVSKYK